MKLTQKQKIDGYAAIAAELSKLQLAIHDLKGESKFRFADTVTVDMNDISTEYTRGEYKARVSVSPRSMPLYMVEMNGRVEFWHEYEIPSADDSFTAYWRVVRHAIWKQSVKKVVAA